MTMVLPISHNNIIRIGRYQNLSLEGLTRETALALHYFILRLRRIEEALHLEYHPADEMRCPVHFCIGQEAIPAALSQLIQPDDFLFSHHRSHGYYLAKNAPAAEMFAEMYGKSSGANGGLAGSQDLSHCSSHFFSGAILTGAASIAVGSAYGFKHKKSAQISVTGFGEGATDEGAFWEAINYAGCAKLPVLFIIENNRYSTYSDQLKRQERDNLCERAQAFGVRSTQIFGNDVTLAYRMIATEISRLRNGQGPALIEAYTYRLNSHVGPEDDSHHNYRSKEEMAFWNENCPLKLLEEKLIEVGWLNETEKKVLENKIQAEIDDCFKFAKESVFPDQADWVRMNLDFSSPMADALLHEEVQGSYDQYQSETKLGPY